MAIAEEKQDNGQSYQVTYIGAQVSFLCEEESAKIVIEDVNISCSI
jgi:hypothetical protein